MKTTKISALILIFLLTLGTPLAKAAAIRAGIRRYGHRLSAEGGTAEDAREFFYWLRESNGEHYQQEEPAKIDPKGDAFLCRKLDQVPMKLLKAIFEAQSGGKEEAETTETETIESANAFTDLIFQAAETNQVQEVAPAPQGEFIMGKEAPLDVKRLLNAVRVAIRRHPELTPHMSHEHRWSVSATKRIAAFWQRVARFVTGKQTDIPAPHFLRSKLFLILSCGWTSRYAITGHEEALSRYILAQKDRSVELHEVFEVSYVLNKGDVYQTLLTAENVLAGNPYRDDRANDPLQKKLVYLRNDSDERGDNYGAWYHFFGIALYGSVRAPWTSHLTGEIESLGSIVLEGKDPQEDHINRLGAKFGDHLERMVADKTYEKPLKENERTDYRLCYEGMTCNEN